MNASEMAELDEEVRALIADVTPGVRYLCVRISVKNPNEKGMATGDECDDIVALERQFIRAINNIGGNSDGYLVGGGYRFIHFYLDVPKETVHRIIAELCEKTDYELQYVYILDPDRKLAWNDFCITPHGEKAFRKPLAAV